MKKNILLVVVLLFIIFSALLMNSNKTSKEEVTEKEVQIEKLNVVDELSREKLSMSALLVLNKDDIKLEKSLYDFSKDYNVNIEKVYYNEEVDSFFKKERSNESYMNEIYEIESRLQILPKNIEDQKDESLVQTYYDELYQKVNEAIFKYSNYEDYTEETDFVLSNTDLSKEEFDLFVNNILYAKDAFIQEDIKPINAPMLILFGEKGEIGRITGFSDKLAGLHWSLLSKGLTTLKLTNEVQNLLDTIEKNETTIVSFGSATCIYCQSTTPNLMELAKEKDMPFVYVDISTIINSQEIKGKLLDTGIITEDISSTPTIVVIQDGKEVRRVNGMITREDIEVLLSEYEK